MIADTKLWWRERSLRERRLLAVMAALLAAVILYYGVVHPVEAGLVAARADQEAALDRNAAIRLRLAALRRPATSLPAPLPPAGAGALPDRIAASAEAAGFTLTRNAAAGSNRADIAIGAARPTALFGWIAALEAQGMTVEMLSVSPAAPGTVAAQAVLAERPR